MKNILLTFLLLFFSQSAFAFPIQLNDNTMAQAKADCQSVGKFDNNDVRQYSYMLGEKSYGFMNNQAPILIDIETPYSRARYNFYKESTIYRDFTDNEKSELIANKDTVKIITRCHAMATSMRLISLPAKNVVIKKNGVVYKSTPLPVESYYLADRKWLFPIELFNGSSDIEIIVIDAYDNVKPLKVTKEKLSGIK